MISELLPALIARQATVRPTATAVVAGDRALSYAELDARAGRLARRLRAAGAGPDTVVGVGLRRGVDLVVALLGIWKAGAGYLPLDPDHPAERRDWIRADAGVCLLVDDVLVDDVLVDDVRARQQADGGPDRGDAGAGDLPVPDGDQVAYVQYTSGSTGRPKGVLVSHAGIGNRVRWLVDTHKLGADDRVLQKTALSFDASALELFAPLVAGGTLVLAAAGTERDPQALLAAVAAERITVLQVVPSVLRLLVEEPGWDGCTALRLLFSAGEPLTAELVQRVRRLADVEVWNTYGPTECSVDITSHRFDDAQAAGPVPIGRPIGGMRVLVLDRNFRPLPVGTAGELHASGIGLARGYLGRAGQTAERFVPDPYGPPGSRLYRTGDLVRWLPDGTLEYVGRLDHQVKINGVRVEPGEVETALSGHPEITGAVVVATGPADARRLIGYLRTRGPGLPADLRGFLAGRLPEPYLPAAFVRVEEFPLTGSGKVDRIALADRPGPAAPPRPVTGPRTPAERLVTGLWAELLKLPEVAVDDDFFQLGGSSLQLARLANRLRAASGRPIEIARLLRATTPAEQALLVDLPADPGPEPDAVRPIPRDGSLPLSFGQHRLWVLDQMRPGDPEWVSPLFVRLPGGVPAGVVGRALDRLVARHESLRTRFPARDGEPVQLIEGPGPVPLRVVDAVPGRLAAVLADELRTPFDIELGPLVRAVLATGPTGDRTLVLVMHHIVVDGWSSAVLDRELRELVTALVQGREPELAPLPVQYADFAAWQRGRLGEDAVAGELAHWRSRLAGLPVLELPTDRPRPPARDARGSVVTFTLPAGLVGGLEKLGRAHSATPFMTLLTGFAAVLARHSGQWDVPVGTPVAGRDRPEVEGVVGFFLNTLVLRCGLRPTDGFAVALDRVREVCTEAFAHQEVPFERLVEELDPERDLSRTPLYQVAFDLHDERLTGSAGTPEDLATLEGIWRIAKTDLTLFLRREADGGMSGGLEYATALFDRSGVQQLARHLVQLLTAGVARPDAPLETADLLGDAERGRLLAVATGPRVAQPLRTVDQDIAEVAARCPEAVAVEGIRAVGGDGAVRWTYRQLADRAGGIARRLVECGVRPESVVGVLVDRSPDLVAGLLAVWRAGGAYLPLDPGFPDERLRHLLADARVDVLLAQPEQAGRLEPLFEGRVLVLEHESAPGWQAGAGPEVATDPDRLAYLIYTSGSTGRPKGVQVTHRGLANHLAWAVRELAARGTGGAPLFSSTAFDLVVPNLWAPLLSGQTVHLLPPDLDPAQLGARLAAAGPFSFVKLTPGHLELLRHQLSDEQARELAGVIVVAGEGLPGELAAHWSGLLGDGRLINEYGPTEASVGSTIHPVDAAHSRPGEVVPIGKPLPGVSCHVLDRLLQPVPAGVTGELYVGGTGVARGYAGRPALTADRFLPDPFGPPGARLYRTGDRTRLLPDGSIAFLGRADEQLKIRGYRIEPGEVRAVLLRHPAVREAVVTADSPAAGQRRLVAHWVPQQPAAARPDEDELTAHCARWLPDYLVPSRFAAIDAVPLNANGKLDAAALPPIGTGSEPVGEPGDEAARTVAQEQIAAIWAGLVTGPEPELHANFFRSGGNSLLAVRLIAQLQATFAVALPVRAVFESPTVAGLATAVEALIRAEIDELSDAELAADPLHFEDRNR